MVRGSQRRVGVELVPADHHRREVDTIEHDLRHAHEHAPIHAPVLAVHRHLCNQLFVTTHVITVTSLQDIASECTCSDCRTLLRIIVPAAVR